MSKHFSIGLIGARGHVGADLISLIAGHPVFDLAFVSSRERKGQLVVDHCAGVDRGLKYEDIGTRDLNRYHYDALILALPNGKAAEFIAEVESFNPDAVVIDLSADYRFDTSWYYGLPELTRKHYRGQRRISNPGCYATAMQLALAPVADKLVGASQCFGVSGYSGAGTTPSEKNDPDKLRDNLMPYSLVDHLHEREVSAQLSHQIEFMPHVAPHFRGLSITANIHLSEESTADDLLKTYQRFYSGEQFVKVQAAVPFTNEISGKQYAKVGGFALGNDGKRVVVVSVLDNLLKGAASQALQNLNLAFSLPENFGLNSEGAA